MLAALFTFLRNAIIPIEVKEHSQGFVAKYRGDPEVCAFACNSKTAVLLGQDSMTAKQDRTRAQ